MQQRYICLSSRKPTLCWMKLGGYRHRRMFDQLSPISSIPELRCCGVHVLSEPAEGWHPLHRGLYAAISQSSALDT